MMCSRPVLRYALAIVGVLLLASGIRIGSASAQDYAAIVASPDRTDADRNNDKKRKPEQILAFTGVKTDMKVMDLVSSAGYSAELLARSVGPNGSVYAVNSKETAERVKDRFEPRMGKIKSLVQVVRNYDDPVPPEVSNLDIVTIYFSYHDLVHMGIDRASMNKKVFAALKPGGFYVVADHSAKAGDGLSVAQTLHRIEESTLRKEVEAAGFKLVAEADFLRNPSDARDSNVNRSTTPNDEFVLKFQKP
jgi:predicted methyltransferase